MAAHNELGRLGERVAVRYLLLHGYEILDVNWHDGPRELDIVATKLGFLIFVEVKTRRNALVDATLAVDERKRHFLLRAAEAYVAQHGLDMPCQFDVITLTGEAEPFQLEHVRDAFSALLEPALRYDGQTGYAPHTWWPQTLN